MLSSFDITPDRRSRTAARGILPVRGRRRHLLLARRSSPTLLARPDVLGIKIATLDSVMTFQDVARLVNSTRRASWSSPVKIDSSATA